MENARKQKTEMEKGMEKWSEKVLNVQVESIKNAEDKVQQGKLEKKLMIGEERKNRESRVCKKQRENKEHIEKKIIEKTNHIENKNERVRNKCCCPFPLSRCFLSIALSRVFWGITLHVLHIIPTTLLY